MLNFEPTPNRITRSRLIVWGMVVATLVFCLACNLLPINENQLLFRLGSGFLFFLSIINVYWREKDYKTKSFQITEDSISSAGQTVATADVECHWFESSFPGGCYLFGGSKVIEIQFDLLSDKTALDAIKTLFVSIPASNQKNWPEFCHKMAVPLYFQIHNDTRTLTTRPAEPDSTKTTKKRNITKDSLWLVAVIGSAILAFKLGGFVGIVCWLLAAHVALAFVYSKLSSDTIKIRSDPNYYSQAQSIWRMEVIERKKGVRSQKIK